MCESPPASGAARASHCFKLALRVADGVLETSRDQLLPRRYACVVRLYTLTVNNQWMARAPEVPGTAPTGHEIAGSERDRVEKRPSGNHAHEPYGSLVQEAVR